MHAQIYNILEGVDLVAAVDKRVEESQENWIGWDAGPKYATLDEAMRAQCDFVDVCLPTHLHEAFPSKPWMQAKLSFAKSPWL